jgi:hypothetical protein
MSTFLPRFMDLPYSGLGGGTSAADLNPYQKMQMMGSELGNMGGQLASTQGLLSAIGGSRQQMVGNAMDSLRSGYDMAGGIYDRAYQAYQNQLQIEEQRRQAAQAAANQAAQQRALEALMAGLGETYNTIPDETSPDEFGIDTIDYGGIKNPGKNLGTAPKILMSVATKQSTPQQGVGELYKYNPPGFKLGQQAGNLLLSANKRLGGRGLGGSSIKDRFKNLFLKKLGFS